VNTVIALSPRQRAELFSGAAQTLGFGNEVIIEKDFWVCWMERASRLRRLSSKRPMPVGFPWLQSRGTKVEDGAIMSSSLRDTRTMSFGLIPRSRA
jgi:hypothetical protein